MLFAPFRKSWANSAHAQTLHLIYPLENLGNKVTHSPIIRLSFHTHSPTYVLSNPSSSFPLFHHYVSPTAPYNSHRFILSPSPCLTPPIQPLLKFPTSPSVCFSPAPYVFHIFPLSLSATTPISILTSANLLYFIG